MKIALNFFFWKTQIIAIGWNEIYLLPPRSMIGKITKKQSVLVSCVAPFQAPKWNSLELCETTKLEACA